MKARLNIILTVSLIILLCSCQKIDDKTETSTIIGNVEFISYSAIPGAVKIQLQSASDASDNDIAYTEQDGSFIFKDVKEGFYFITPTKENYSWVWTVVNDNDPIHRNSSDKKIKVGAGEIVKVDILMSISNVNTLSFLSPKGEPINKLVINKGEGSISFVLFNGTGSARSYSVRCGCLFKTTFDAFELFSSINPSSGSLSPGESVMITCNIDPRVYNSSLALFDDIEISYNLKLPLSLNWNLSY